MCTAALGRELNKEMQTSDWGRRPLSALQLKYAALDAYVLLMIYDVISYRVAIGHVATPPVGSAGHTPAANPGPSANPAPDANPLDWSPLNYGVLAPYFGFGREIPLELKIKFGLT
jgi:3'-5' exonuclease